MSLFTHKTFCMDSNKSFKAENQVFVNYLSLSDLIIQRITSELWFDCIMKSNNLTTI